ncbi:MAG: DUF2520 domain-containing protein [Lachnospiraceae bacterium]|nr:DUF2520 domain-containing protein [Lachnospiraceae bacterium]MDY6220817.1 DUF2520 domain-containing protein [Candidatus Alectryocaccobium sp.]
MRIGFMGAGKVGFTLGKYFTEHNVSVSGYSSRTEESAVLASKFTNTEYFKDLRDLINASDAIFITCPDGQIKSVWDRIRRYPIKGKCICHCSGALSSAVFSEIDRAGAYGYSIHPLFAVRSKEESYREISNSFFTIEGNEKYLGFWEAFFDKLGNKTKIITAENKTLYHASGVFVSNLVCGLFEEGIRLLMNCGFSRDEAKEALSPMLLNNAGALKEVGPVEALTGPVERADVSTIKKHLGVLAEREKRIYESISGVLVDIAKIKHPDRDYGEVLNVLNDQKKDMERKKDLS